MSSIIRRLFVVVFAWSMLLGTAHAADDYSIDISHSSVTFMIQHLGISFVHGRFNEFSGDFTIDKQDPGKSSFTMQIKAASVDTAIKKRDDHLRNADFFDVEKYPLMTFKSTSVKATETGYKVTGDFTMHGVTKSVTFDLKGGKTVEFPKGKHRTGFASAFILRRADFGMNGFLDGIANEVHIYIGMEGIKK